MEEVILILEKYKLPKLNYKVHWRARVNQLMKSRLERYYVTIVQGYKKTGKTTTIVEYLSRLQKRKKIHIIWLRCENLNQQMIKEVRVILTILARQVEKKSVYIVADGLEKIQNATIVSGLFGIINQNFENVRYILSTQGAIPSCAISLMSQQRCNLISWFQLLYENQEILEYFNQMRQGEEDAITLEYPSYLFPIPWIMGSCLFCTGSTKREKDFYYTVNIKKMRSIQDQFMIEEWTEKTKRLLSKIYIYRNITVEMIEYLFPLENMQEVAKNFSDECCLLMKTGDAAYTIDCTLANYIRVIVEERFERDKIRRNYQIGARYYQEKKQYQKALELYWLSGDYKKIVQVVLDSIVVVSDEVEVGKLIIKLETIPIEILNEYPMSYVLLCLKEICLFRMKKAEQWFKQLKMLYHKSARQLPLSKKQKECVECYLMMVLLFPGCKDENTYRNIREQVGDFCLNGYIEYLSNIRWAAYICTNLTIIWGTKLWLVKLDYNEKLKSFLGEYGMCYMELYAGFIYALKAKKKKGIYYLTKGIGRCFKNDLIDGAIFGEYVLDLYLFNGNWTKDIRCSQQLYEMREQTNVFYIKRAYESYLIQEKLFVNDEIAISRWWQENNCKMREMSNFNSYRRYVTMIRVALYKGCYSKAQAWIELMIENSIELNADLMLVELYSLYAFFWDLNKNERGTIEYIHKALELMKKNGFYNNLAIDGTMSLKVLDLYKEKVLLGEKNNFFEKVYCCTEIVAKRYPNYFSANSNREVKLTPAELGMLRELNTGKSLQEIAQTLCISLNTVKHHTKNIYSKLKVNKRMLAVEEAKELGIL